MCGELGDPYPMERYVRSTYVWGIRRSLSHGALCKVYICVGYGAHCEKTNKKHENIENRVKRFRIIWTRRLIITINIMI